MLEGEPRLVANRLGLTAGHRKIELDRVRVLLPVFDRLCRDLPVAVERLDHRDGGRLGPAVPYGDAIAVLGHVPRDARVGDARAITDQVERRAAQDADLLA